MSNYEAIIVAPGDASCELELVPEFAGITNRLRLSTADGKSFNILAGLSSREEMVADASFRGMPLFPFANRLDAGAYRHQEQSYQFDINEAETNNTLHGFLYQMPAELLSSQQTENEAKATLVYRYAGNNVAYPFPVEIKISYCLSQKEGFVMNFEVTNLHNETIPVGVGWHPYFQFANKVDSLSLRLPPVNIVEVDERMLPTGVQREFNNFNRLTRIGDTLFDDSMVLQKGQAAEKFKTLLWSEEDNIGIEIWQQTGTESESGNNGGYDFLQVYIPPDRQSIAIEPVSSGINAFNSGDGLIHLEAGQTFTANCGVRLTQDINN